MSVIDLRRKFPVSAVAATILLALPAYSTFASASKAAQQAGSVLFRDKGCTYCHGTAAQGTPKGPSLANVRKKLKAAQIATQIEDGGQKMPSFRDSLSDPEVAELVAYLRAKHRPVPPPAQTPTP